MLDPASDHGASTPRYDSQTPYLKAHGLHGTGEARLMGAILDDAVKSLRLYRLGRRNATGKAERTQIRELECWFERDDYNWPFSFVNVCSVLGLDPGCVRAHLDKWSKNRVKNGESRTGRWKDSPDA